MPKIIKTKIPREKKKHRKHSTKTIYIISAFKGLLVAFTGLLLISLLLLKNNNFTFFYKMVIYLVIGLGGFVSGFTAHARVKGKGFIDGLISSSVYVQSLSLILIIILKLNFSAHMFIIFPVALLSGFFGGIAKV